MTEIGLLATDPLFGLPLPELWFALLFFIFGMFLFLDGFDFGVGILFATRDDEHEKEQLLAAVGPFWDGNEVWLVVFGGALFAALMFPHIDRAAELTIRDAIISTLSLNLMTIMASVLLPLVLVYFAILYSAFSGPIEGEETYG